MAFRLKLLEKSINSLKNNALLPSILNVYVERYSFGSFFNDIFAGIKIFVLLFPLLISLAIVCGESPISGLITGILAMCVSAIFSGLKYQISAISFPVCTLTTEIMSRYQYKGIFITSVLVYIIMYIFGRLKIGEILKYISSTFLSAIYIYVAMAILVTQLQSILGLSINSISTSVFSNIKTLINNIGNITALNLHYAASFLGFLLVLRFIFKGYLSFFIYLVLCTIVLIFSEFNIIPNINYINLKTIGAGSFNNLDFHNIFSISYTLPSQLILEHLIIYAFAISLIIAAQVSTCTSMGSSITANNKESPNTELIATGLSNVLSVSSGGLFVSPDTELSIQNIQYNAKSIIAGLSTASLIFCSWHFKDNVFRYIPMYAISSILIVLSLCVFRAANIKQYIKYNFKEKYVFWTTLIIAIYFGFISAVFIGFTLSLFLFTHRLINIHSPSVYTNKNHDKYITEFLLNKYEYLNTKENYKIIFDKVEIIQLDNLLSLNILEKTRQVLSSCLKHANFIIVYFRNIPFLDGKAITILQEFVKSANKAGYKVIVCGTNGLLLEILQKKEKESNVRNAFGYIIPNFKDAINMVLKSTKK